MTVENGKEPPSVRIGGKVLEGLGAGIGADLLVKVVERIFHGVL